MSQVKVLQYSRAELEQNLSKLDYPNGTSFIYNSKAELTEDRFPIGRFVVNNTITKLGENVVLLNANATIATPLGVLEVLFTSRIITDVGILGNDQLVKASIVHTTGIYEGATEVNIQALDDDAKTSIISIVY
jgi:hypothetical protein